MDFSLIPTALSGIATSLGIAKTALEVRDFTQAGAAVADVTQKLLDLQTQFLASNAAFMQLQQEHADLTQRVREMEKLRADREQYSLFEITPGVFVYRFNSPREAATADNPEPLHYLCPGCFNQDEKMILQFRNTFWHCNKCSASYRTGRDNSSTLTSSGARSDIYGRVD